jgi:Zn-finger protein
MDDHQIHHATDPVLSKVTTPLPHSSANPFSAQMACQRRCSKDHGGEHFEGCAHFPTVNAPELVGRPSKRDSLKFVEAQEELERMRRMSADATSVTEQRERSRSDSNSIKASLSQFDCAHCHHIHKPADAVKLVADGTANVHQDSKRANIHTRYSATNPFTAQQVCQRSHLPHNTKDHFTPDGHVAGCAHFPTVRAPELSGTPSKRDSLKFIEAQEELERVRRVSADATSVAEQSQLSLIDSNTIKSAKFHFDCTHCHHIHKPADAVKLLGDPTTGVHCHTNPMTTHLACQRSHLPHNTKDHFAHDGHVAGCAHFPAPVALHADA